MIIARPDATLQSREGFRITLERFNSTRLSISTLAESPTALMVLLGGVWNLDVLTAPWAIVYLIREDAHFAIVELLVPQPSRVVIRLPLEFHVRVASFSPFRLDNDEHPWTTTLGQAVLPLHPFLASKASYPLGTSLTATNMRYLSLVLVCIQSLSRPWHLVVRVIPQRHNCFVFVMP
jgi:hypothetical protein